MHRYYRAFPQKRPNKCRIPDAGCSAKETKPFWSVALPHVSCITEPTCAPLDIRGRSATVRRMEARIIQLETLAALQDQTLANLSQELFRQQREIDQLRRSIQLLEQRLAEQKAPDATDPNERPPHW